jgi:hypothetical protein
VPLDVEDGVDADGVRAATDGRADHHEFPAQARPDPPVDLGGGHQRELTARDLHVGEVDQVPDGAVDDEEGEVRAHRLGVHHHGRFQAHLGRELRRGTFRERPLLLAARRQRQRERDLDPPVAGGVPVRPDHRVALLRGAHDRPASRNCSRPSRNSLAGLK